MTNNKWTIWKARNMRKVKAVGELVGGLFAIAMLMVLTIMVAAI